MELPQIYVLIKCSMFDASYSFVYFFVMKFIYLSDKKSGNYYGLGITPSYLMIHSKPYSLTSYPKARQNFSTFVLAD